MFLKDQIKDRLLWTKKPYLQTDLKLRKQRSNLVLKLKKRFVFGFINGILHI